MKKQTRGEEEGEVRSHARVGGILNDRYSVHASAYTYEQTRGSKSVIGEQNASREQLERELSVMCFLPLM